jgi:hypothetical protein
LLEQYEETLKEHQDQQIAYLDAFYAEADAKLEKLEYTIEINLDINDQELKLLETLLTGLEDTPYSQAEQIAYLAQSYDTEKSSADTEQAAINQIMQDKLTEDDFKNWVNGEEIDSLKIIALGDVDKSGVVDSTDYMQIKGVFLGTHSFDEASTKAGDTDESGAIDTTDYLRIKSYFLDITELQPNNPTHGKINYAQNKKYSIEGKRTYNGGLADNGVILTDGIIPDNEIAGQTIAFSGTNSVNTITIDLEKLYADIREIIVGGVRVNGNRQYGNIVIEVSSDNNTYHRVSDYTLTETLTNETGTYNYSYVLSENTIARYVKITFTSTSYILTLGEIEVCGNI